MNDFDMMDPTNLTYQCFSERIQQMTHFECLKSLVEAGNRFRSTPIVDDDFPAIRDTFDDTLREATNHLRYHKTETDWVANVERLHSKFRRVRDIVRNMPDEQLKGFFLHRLEFLREELLETCQAKNPSEIVDGLVDLIVVAIGTLDLFGVDIHKAWKEVHEANMKRVPIQSGQEHKRKDHYGLNLIKPEGWKDPDHSDNVGILDRVFSDPSQNVMGVSYKGE